MKEEKKVVHTKIAYTFHQGSAYKKKGTCVDRNNISKFIARPDEVAQSGILDQPIEAPRLSLYHVE